MLLGAAGRKAEKKNVIPLVNKPTRNHPQRPLAAVAMPAQTPAAITRT